MIKLKEFFKKYKIEILSFSIPILIFIVACIVCGLFPFGNKILSTYDGIAQYPGFSINFAKILRGQESFFYSFKGGLGFNFYATFVYYLSNPTNLLSIFASENNIVLYYFFIIILRIGLSGFTMTLLLKHKNKNSRFRIIFSICYALMSYNVLYYYNYMYFDTIVLFPLVIIGLDKLIHNSNPKLYFITLSLSIFSNFYIGYMICIFSLLYFIYSYILLEKENRKKKVIFDFIKYSILAALVNAVLLVPVVLEIMNGKISMFENSNGFTKYWEFSKDYIFFIYRLTIGSYKTGDMTKSLPNIYTSIFALILAVMFFFNKKISKKERIVTAIFFAFFILCFTFNFLDYSWHMFQRPVWYPKRYSFCFSLLMILIASKCFNNIDGFIFSSKKKWIIYGVLIILILLSAMYNEIYTSNARLVFLLLSVICITEYFLTLDTPKFHLFIIMIFFIEILGNTIFAFKNISFSRTYNTFNDTTQNISEAIKYIEAGEEENSFYRTEITGGLISTNGGMFNYNAVKYFNSLRNQKVMNFLSNIDQRVVDGCSVSYYTDNPIYNSILGIKYMDGLKYDNLYESTDNTGLNIYKNQYALNLGFSVSKDILSSKLQKNELLNNSNELINKMIGKQYNFLNTINYTSYENITITQGIAKTKFDRISNEKGTKIFFKGKVNEDTIIIFPYLSRNTSIKLSLNEGKDNDYGNQSNFALLLEKGDEYVITIILNAPDGYIEDYLPVKMSLANFELFIKEMKKNELIITKYEKDNYIKGEVTITKDKPILFTSIPYDDGWHVSINGKEMKKEKVLDAFIGLELEPGKYEIEFKFIPRGIIIGSITSAFSIILSIFLLKKKKTRTI